MEDINMDYTTDLLPDLDLGENVSFLINLTASKSSSVDATLSPGINQAVSIILIVALTINMVSMGCTMEVSKIKKNILKPKGVAIAILSQYGVMPLAAFLLSKAFQLQGMMTVAVLVCGCSPGGAFSNVLALAVKGDMNLSYSSRSDMEDINMDYTTDLLPDLDLGENVSFLINLTASKSSSVDATLSPGINQAVSIILIVALTINMVSMGCTMEVSKIKKNILKPKGVAIAILAQYGVMPLAAFLLSKVFQLQGMMTVAVLICGCSPGGAFSNVLALAVKGDMNLSIVMTTCSTVLALGMMPLLLYLYCQGFPGLHKLLPYTEIVISLALILVPCGIGIIINHYRPKYANIFMKVGITVLVVFVFVIGLLIIIDMGSGFMTVLNPNLMAICVTMPIIGYSFGYIISSLFRLGHSQRRTVAMETGCQNIQLCTTILKVAFPPAEVGPLFMFPMIFGMFQLLEAGVLITLFRCYERFASKDKESCQPVTDDNVNEPLKKLNTDKNQKDPSLSEV